jgi:hypothetical protein
MMNVDPREWMLSISVLMSPCNGCQRRIARVRKIINEGTRLPALFSYWYECLAGIFRFKCILLQSVRSKKGKTVALPRP